MLDGICGWHTQSNSFKKGSQLSSVVFAGLERKYNNRGAVDLHGYCCHVDEYKTALSTVLLPINQAAHSALLLPQFKLKRTLKTPKPNQNTNLNK